MKFWGGPAKHSVQTGGEVITPAAQQRDAPRRRRSAARMQGADRVAEAERRKELA